MNNTKPATVKQQPAALAEPFSLISAVQIAAAEMVTVLESQATKKPTTRRCRIEENAGSVEMLERYNLTGLTPLKCAHGWMRLYFGKRQYKMKAPERWNVTRFLANQALAAARGEQLTADILMAAVCHYHNVDLIAKDPDTGKEKNYGKLPKGKGALEVLAAAAKEHNVGFSVDDVGAIKESGHRQGGKGGGEHLWQKVTAVEEIETA